MSRSQAKFSFEFFFFCADCSRQRKGHVGVLPLCVYCYNSPFTAFLKHVAGLQFLVGICILYGACGTRQHWHQCGTQREKKEHSKNRNVTEKIATEEREKGNLVKHGTWWCHGRSKRVHNKPRRQPVHEAARTRFRCCEHSSRQQCQQCQ